MGKEFKYKYMLIPCTDDVASKEILVDAINHQIDNLVEDLQAETTVYRERAIDNVRDYSNQICELMKQRNHIIMLGSNNYYGASSFEYDDKLVLLND